MVIKQKEQKTKLKLEAKNIDELIKKVETEVGKITK